MLVFLHRIHEHCRRSAELQARHAHSESSKTVSSWGRAGIAIRSCGRVGETRNQCAHSGEATDPHTTDFPIEATLKLKTLLSPFRLIQNILIQGLICRANCVPLQESGWNSHNIIPTSFCLPERQFVHSHICQQRLYELCTFIVEPVTQASASEWNHKN
jgi:hypothetical protein